ncbi:uncharacterized protein LOC133785296 [Humulus lupulus]|uniref:uncharacterized protein LOC133785296 n=1 Tax=Humulus lupulus TaxID=3486 RepID=UPI002B412AF7|nr:uncharacterized protein LOC133785296 [Humulus lupulus]
MDARSEEIRQRQEEADRGHREATLVVEAATQLTQANAQTAARGETAQGTRNNNAGRRTAGRTNSRGPDRSRSNPPSQEDDGVHSGTSSTQRENSRTPSRSHQLETSRSGSDRSGNSHHTNRSKDKKGNDPQGGKDSPGRAEMPPVHPGQQRSEREQVSCSKPSEKSKSTVFDQLGGHTSRKDLRDVISDKIRTVPVEG